jgi:uncharacterized protein
MGTISTRSSLKNLLFGSTRTALLSLFFTHTDERFHLSQVVRIVNKGRGSVQRELQNLHAAGIIKREAEGNQVYFQANIDCPFFTELKGLVIKTAGIVDIIRSTLAPLNLDFALIYGSFAKGDERASSDVDLMVSGSASFGDVVKVLGPAQDILGREINPIVYYPDEFDSKLKKKDSFVMSVIKGPKLMVIGDLSEFERMAG